MLYIMTHNLSIAEESSFLSSSLPLTIGVILKANKEQPSLLLQAVQSWTGNHGNTVLASLIPRPCQRVDEYLRGHRPIQHLHERKPSRAAWYENTPGRSTSDGPLSGSFAVSHGDGQTDRLHPLSNSKERMQRGYTRLGLLQTNKVSFILWQMYVHLKRHSGLCILWFILHTFFKKGAVTLCCDQWSLRLGGDCPSNLFPTLQSKRWAV